MPRKNITKKHPEAVDKKTASIQVGRTDLDEWAKNQIGLVQDDFDDRQVQDEKMNRMYKKRYGVRPATKNHPYPNAPNYHVFLSDEKIRKRKPNYMNLAFEGEPIVTMEALGQTPIQNAVSAELFMDWNLRFKMNQIPGLNYFESLAITVDRMMEQGIGTVKITQEYLDRHRNRVVGLESLPPGILDDLEDRKTDRDSVMLQISLFTGLDLDNGSDKQLIDRMTDQWLEGAETVKMKFREVVYSGQRVTPVERRDLVVPAATTHIQSAPRITHRIWLTENDLRQYERSGKYRNVDKVLKGNRPVGGQTRKDLTGTTLEETKRRREGVGLSPKDTHLIEIWEIYTYYDVDSDFVEEQSVLTIHPDTGTVLRFIEYPYDHGKWPFLDFPFELNDDRRSSPRGLVEMLDHYQTIITNEQNAKLARMELANTLQFKYRIGQVNPANVRFNTTQGIPVHRMDDIQELQIQNLDLSFDREIDKDRQFAEEYVGQPDLNQGSLSGGRERRTALEVNEMIQLGRQIFSFDARLFKNSLTRLYDQIWELHQQYGSDIEEVRVTGGDPVTLTREDLQGNFNVVPNGDFTVLSRTLAEQKAFALLELATRDTTGALNAYRAWEDYLLRYNSRAARRVLNDEQTYLRTQELRLKQAELDQARKEVLAGRRPAAAPQIGRAETAGIRGGQNGQGAAVR